MIYAFGDGFATGHMWPEWPQLLQLVVPNTKINLCSVPGAGNEFIYDCAFKSALKARSDDFFIVQWALPSRFDKIKQDQVWEDLHNSDIVYSGIRPSENGLNWYCTSASTVEQVVTYKNMYVQEVQAINRTVLFMLSLAETLNNRQIGYLFMNTYNMHMLADHANYSDLCNLTWADGLNGQQEWCLQNPEIRGTAIQPSTLSHLDYIANVMSDKLPFTVDAIRVNNIRMSLQKAKANG